MSANLKGSGAAGPEIQWIDWHTGKPHANPMASSLHAAPTCTGSPDFGWSLYSRGGSCWETRTRRVIPPAPGMQPIRTRQGWVRITADRGRCVVGQWNDPEPEPPRVRRPVATPRRAPEPGSGIPDPDSV